MTSYTANVVFDEVQPPWVDDSLRQVGFETAWFEDRGVIARGESDSLEAFRDLLNDTISLHTDAFAIDDSGEVATLSPEEAERAVAECGATVETFSTFCHCKPPRLDLNDVCRCGVAWA